MKGKHMNKLYLILFCFVNSFFIFTVTIKSQEIAVVKKAEVANQINLVVETKAPNSAGVHILKATVSYQTETFPVAFNLILQKEYFENKNAYPVMTSLHCRDQMGIDGKGNAGNGGLLGEGMGNLMVHDIGSDSRGLSGEMSAIKINPCKDIQFIGILPQLPSGRNWEDALMGVVVVEIINWVEKNFRVDKDRCYLTGYSYAGYGTWAIGMQYPERFAAIVPNAARLPLAYETATERLKNVSVWCSVGDGDGDFFASCSKMNELFVVAKHPNFRFYVVKNGGHHCYQSVFSNPEFWKWLLAQKRKPKPELVNKK